MPTPSLFPYLMKATAQFTTLQLLSQGLSVEVEAMPDVTVEQEIDVTVTDEIDVTLVEEIDVEVNC